MDAHPVGLRVVRGGQNVLDAKEATKGRPGRLSKLGAVVRGQCGRDPKTRDLLGRGSDASVSGIM